MDKSKEDRIREAELNLQDTQKGLKQLKDGLQTQRLLQNPDGDWPTAIEKMTELLAKRELELKNAIESK